MESDINSSAEVDGNGRTEGTSDAQAAHADHIADPTAAAVLWLHSGEPADSSNDRKTAGSGEPCLGFAALGSDLPKPGAAASRAACARVRVARRSSPSSGPRY